MKLLKCSEARKSSRSRATSRITRIETYSLADVKTDHGGSRATSRITRIETHVVSDDGVGIVGSRATSRITRIETQLPEVRELRKNQFKGNIQDNKD